MRLPKGLSVIEHNGLTLAQLYNTLIVALKDEGEKITINLNSGGWTTKHTKKCINLVLNPYGVRVYQKQFKWYIDTNTGTTLEFNDNMTFSI